MSKKQIFIGLLIVVALAGFLNKDVLMNLFFGVSRGPSYQKDTLRIVLSTPETDLSPHSLDLNNLIRTANLYEGLVAFDRNLRIVPALAVSWGNVNPLTWEFKLRKGVLFHDGSPFGAQSVVDAFGEARTSGGSQVKTLLQTVDDIKIVDPFTLQVVTREPDPLILSKLTQFLITKGDRNGTGPYKIERWEKGLSLFLTVHTDYWGPPPTHEKVDYRVVPGRNQRRDEFEDGLTDILVAVPRDQALELPKEQVRTSYSLEVNFLMFNLADPLLADRSVREALREAFDPARIEEIGNFFVRSVSQFVAPGVFGYNPDIPPFDYQKDDRPTMIFGDRREKITLDYPETYRTLAEYIRQQLTDTGFLVEENILPPEELLERIRNNQSQLFIIGWQAENGDAGGFLDAFIHSGGEFNHGRYQNPFVDKLIEKSRSELNADIRLKTLQQIMELANNDLIGVPLFESSRLYAVKKGVTWEPRLDGLVLAKEVR